MSQAFAETNESKAVEYSFFVSERTPAPFNVGLVIHLQAVAERFKNVRFPVYTAGWVRPHLLMTYHLNYDTSILAIPVGIEMIARYLYQGQVYGFKTKLFHKQSEPLDLWFLEYPKRIEVKNLRQSSRIPITVEVTTSDGEIYFTRDISTHGASLMTSSGKDGIHFERKVGQSIDLNFKLPDGTGISALNAAVVRVYSEHNHQMLGIKFDENDFIVIGKVSQYLAKFEKDFFDIDM